jgi:hypothetical protein
MGLDDMGLWAHAYGALSGEDSADERQLVRALAHPIDRSSRAKVAEPPHGSRFSQETDVRCRAPTVPWGGHTWKAACLYPM